MPPEYAGRRNSTPINLPRRSAGGQRGSSVVMSGLTSLVFSVSSDAQPGTAFLASSRSSSSLSRSCSRRSTKTNAAVSQASADTIMLKTIQIGPRLVLGHVALRVHARRVVPPLDSSHPSPIARKKPPLIGGRSGSPRKRDSPPDAGPEPVPSARPCRERQRDLLSGHQRQILAEAGVALLPQRTCCHQPSAGQSPDRRRQDPSSASTPRASGASSSSRTVSATDGQYSEPLVGGPGPSKRAWPVSIRHRWRRSPMVWPTSACVESTSTLPELTTRTESGSSSKIGLSEPTSICRPSCESQAGAAIPAPGASSRRIASGGLFSLGLLLQSTDQACVGTVHVALVCPSLATLTPVEHDDLVAVADRAKPVRDDGAGADLAA